MATAHVKRLNSAELHDFFENVAVMLSVGVQTEEAVHMLTETAEDGALQAAAHASYQQLIGGNKLSKALEETHRFPTYATQLIKAGEQTGHLEETLRSLAFYYGEEDRLFQKARVAIGYPCILLCVLSAILAFTIGAILPIFLNVYNAMAGGLAASSFGIVSVGIAIGWIALGVTIVLALAALAALALSKSAEGRHYLLSLLNLIPFAQNAIYNLALSRFTSTLAVYTASGSNIDDAVGAALQTIDNAKLHARVAAAYGSMIEPVRACGLAEAFALHNVYDAKHIRMLTFSMHTGRIDTVLTDLSQAYFEDAIEGFDAMVDKIEPALAGFVTVAVGATLIAVMLPLIGMMTSMG